MKQEILKILNLELQRADKKINEAKEHLNYSSALAWKEYKSLIKTLVKRVQDYA